MKKSLSFSFFETQITEFDEKKAQVLVKQILNLSTQHLYETIQIDVKQQLLFFQVFTFLYFFLINKIEKWEYAVITLVQKLFSLHLDSKKYHNSQTSQDDFNRSMVTPFAVESSFIVTQLAPNHYSLFTFSFSFFLSFFCLSRE